MIGREPCVTLTVINLKKKDFKVLSFLKYSIFPHLNIYFDLKIFILYFGKIKYRFNVFST
jgi:hypothetical protein